ncbi:MAG: SDR family NAD(P)-dependent oxidoreductase, partial [Thermoleophilaceae bacterium]
MCSWSAAARRTTTWRIRRSATAGPCRSCSAARARRWRWPDINRDSAEATAELVRAEGAEATVVVADAAGEDGVAAMFAETREALDGIDGLVLNVGVGQGFLLSGTSAEDWDRVMAVNLRSQFLGCKHGIAELDEGGAIVLIGSVAAREVMPIPAYAASKAASESLCRQAAVEGAPRVRVNVLHPGLIDTPLG